MPGTNPNPRGSTKNDKIVLYTTTVVRKNGRFAQADNGKIAHSAYHGCTTGKNTTITNVDTPNAPTGEIRPK